MPKKPPAMGSIIVDKIASVTQACGLSNELRISSAIPCEEGIVLAGHPSREVRADQVVPAVVRHDPVSGGEVDTRVPLRRAALEARRRRLGLHGTRLDGDERIVGHRHRATSRSWGRSARIRVGPGLGNERDVQ